MDVFDCCKSFVIHEKSGGHVRFTHFSVQEYLNVHGETILPPRMHLAKTCLAYLAFFKTDFLFLDQSETNCSGLETWDTDNYENRYGDPLFVGYAETNALRH